MPFAKGNKLGGRTFGSKNATTLAKEERRAQFDVWMSEMFKEKVRQARPEYLLDQFLGKSPDVTKLEVTDTTRELTAEELAMFEEIVRRKKLGDHGE